MHALYRIILVSTALLLALFGCNSPRSSRTSTPLPALAASVDAQVKKDAVVTAEATRIDVAVANTPVAEEVKVSTDAQRAAVVAAPAADLLKITAGYEAEIKTLSEAKAKLETRLVELQDAERKKQVTLLRLIGVAAVLAAVTLAYFRMTGFAALAGATALFAFGMGQLISQPWFATVFNWSLGITAVIAVGVGVFEWRRVLRTRALTSSEALTAKETREALLVVVEQIDLARAVPEFAPFYSKMLENWDWSEKEIVAKLRSEIALDKIKREHA